MFTSTPYQETKSCESPVKHTDNYKIVVILDESGSMEVIGKQMRNALNDLIKEQKQVTARPCNFTLVKFNDTVRRVIKSTDLTEIRLLTEEDYRPNGSTALYDAIGDTINWYRYERDVLMVIITDGQENASKKFRKDQITKMIKEKETHCGWSYVYLNCDLQTAAQGDAIGLNESAKCSNCVVPQADYGKFVSEKFNSAVTNHRKYGISVQSQLI